MPKTNTETPSFAHWAIVELMGRQVIAGLAAEVALFGTTLLRVDVPEVNGVPGFTKFFGGSAIYALTPVDEAAARQAAAEMRVKPVAVYILPKRQLPLPQMEPEEEDYDWP